MLVLAFEAAVSTAFCNFSFLIFVRYANRAMKRSSILKNVRVHI